VFVGVGPTFGWGAYPYAYPYTDDYGYAPTTAWYCPSYGAYYPSVTTCPDPWVPVQ
jgi:hypothetical protein